MEGLRAEVGLVEGKEKEMWCLFGGIMQGRLANKII